MVSLATPVRPCEPPPHFVGGFADYYYVKSKQHVFKVPDGVDDSVFAGANCALSQVLHGLEEARIKFGDYVVVQGAGGLGLFACTVEMDGRDVARANVSVFQPADAQAFLQGQQA